MSDGRLLGVIFWGFVAAIGYGEYDALVSGKLSDPGFLAQPVDAMFVTLDALEAFDQPERGQVFVSLTWKAPKDEARIDRIHMIGKVTEPGQPDVPFARNCQRATTVLSDVSESSEIDRSNFSNLVCFIEVDKVVPISKDSTGQNSMVDIQAFKTRLTTMRVSYSAQAYGRRPPMAYISSINGTAVRAYQYLTGLFARKWTA